MQATHDDTICNRHHEGCDCICQLSTKTPSLLPGHPVRPQVSAALAVWGNPVTCLCQRNVREAVCVTSEARLSEAGMSTPCSLLHSMKQSTVRSAEPHGRAILQEAHSRRPILQEAHSQVHSLGGLCLYSCLATRFFMAFFFFFPQIPYICVSILYLFFSF